MLLVAEIADKMFSPLGCWSAGLCVSLPLLAIAAAGRWGAGVALFLALLLSGFLTYGSYREAWLEGAFSDAVWNELGWPYVVSSFGAAWLPTLLVAVGIAVKYCPSMADLIKP